MQLCSKPRGARGIEPETFQRRGRLLLRPPTTGCVIISCTSAHNAANPNLRLIPLVKTSELRPTMHANEMGTWVWTLSMQIRSMRRLLVMPLETCSATAA